MAEIQCRYSKNYVIFEIPENGSLGMQTISFISIKFTSSIRALVNITVAHKGHLFSVQTRSFSVEIGLLRGNTHMFHGNRCLLRTNRRLLRKDMTLLLGNTVEPLLTDTPIKRTPLLSGHLSKVPAISLIKPYSYNPF